MKALAWKIILLIGLISPLLLNGQEQVIKGTVIDKTTRSTLIGATIYIEGSEPIIGTISNELGEFTLSKVPVGRHTVRCDYLGFTAYLSHDMIVSSAKEIVLEIEMQEASQQIQTIVIQPDKRVDRALNEMSLLSSRSFSIEETERYAGSLADPSRMATGFAGVQAGIVPVITFQLDM